MPTPQDTTAQDNSLGAGDYESNTLKDFADWKSAFDYIYNVFLAHRHRGIDQSRPLLSNRTELHDTGNIDLDVSLASHFYVTLAGNRTLNNPTGARDGQRIILEVIQDATGSRTLSFGSKFNFGDIGTPTLTTTAAKRDFLGFVYSAKDDTFYVLAFATGY